MCLGQHTVNKNQYIVFSILPLHCGKLFPTLGYHLGLANVGSRLTYVNCQSHENIFSSLSQWSYYKFSRNLNFSSLQICPPPSFSSILIATSNSITQVITDSYIKFSFYLFQDQVDSRGPWAFGHEENC